MVRRPCRQETELAEVSLAVDSERELGQEVDPGRHLVRGETPPGRGQHLGLRPGGGLDEAVDEVCVSLQDTHGWDRQLATQDLANLLQTNFPVLPGKVYRQKFDVKSLPSHHLHYIVLSSSPVEHPLITAPRTNIASLDCSQTLQL